MVKFEYSVEEPLNREPPLKELISSFITEKNGYDRNHGPIPHLSADTHTLRVDGAVRNLLTLSISQLQHDFPQHRVICALQCAGNRRHTMSTQLKEVQGIDWFDGAVMNCEWRGPRLKDVLERGGVELEREKWGGAHVAFACYQAPCQEDSWYGGNIPLERAMRADAEVVLAVEMNGKPLPTNHGHPVRVIAPGIAGARSVKWLDRITVQLHESPNFYQQHDYKVLPPEAVDAETAQQYWHRVPAIQEMPVNSVVGVPSTGDTVSVDGDGMVEARGYALPSGEDGPVVRVEVSGDEGRSWVDAELIGSGEQAGEEGTSLKWAWCLWRARVRVEKGQGRRILSRATDKAGDVQEESSQWNLRGVAYNGYGEARDLTVI